MEYLTKYWIEKYIALLKKDSNLVLIFLIFRIFFQRHLQSCLSYMPRFICIPIRKDDFVLCMVNGYAMHLNGVTVTISLKSHLSLILGVYASHYETNKNKINQLCSRVD